MTTNSTCLTLTALAGFAALGGLPDARRAELVVDEGVGVTAVRSRCPAVGVPNPTGDVTLFGQGGRRPPTISMSSRSSPTCARSVPNRPSRSRRAFR